VNIKNNVKRDELKGKPQKFVPGHQSLRHGHSIHGTTGAYRTWLHMIARCTNPAQECYKDYGGRGIKVCERWMKYLNFYDDMGDRPNGMTIDRIDNDKGYFYDNCRWATPTQQGNNRRSNRVLIFEGKRYTLKELAIKYGMGEATLHNRLDKYKLTVEEAVTIPVRRGIYVRNRRTSNTD
jgi:hypothetical protein